MRIDTLTTYFVTPDATHRTEAWWVRNRAGDGWRASAFWDGTVRTVELFDDEDGDALAYLREPGAVLYMRDGWYQVGG